MNKSNINFEKLKDIDVHLAYSIICKRIDFLSKINITQYVEPYPQENIYIERQKKGLNYGLYVSSKLAVIITLIPNYIPNDWIEYKSDKQTVWISTLFSNEEFSGNNLGNQMMEEAEIYLESQGYTRLLLDCFINKDEFLVKYYTKLGYKELLRKKVVYPIHTFNAALMEKNLVD